MSLYLISKDPKLRSRINRQLKKGCTTATNHSQLATMRVSMHHDRFPVVLIDDAHLGSDKLPLVRKIMLQHLPGRKIILVEHPRIERPEGYVLDGTFGMINRNCSIDQLLSCVIDAIGVHAVHEHLTDAQMHRILQQHNTDSLDSYLIGVSQAIETIRSIILRIATIFSCVHIYGETGTGKEVVAQLLRHLSGNPDPFVVVNCSTIPETLADTHLFGNERGAYTDAKEEAPGYIARAHNGILFLDELEDMPLSIQGKLLRLLETNRYRKVGGTSVQYSNFKLITASNVPLDQLRNEHRLRSDLYYRLKRLVIAIPPLRERREDIPLLINHFLRRLEERRRPDAKTLSKMMDYPWPGNARELFHELERLSIFADQSAHELSYTEILTESVLNSTCI